MTDESSVFVLPIGNPPTNLDFENVKILVLGDVMLDRFVYGDVSCISPEAPVPVVRVRDVGVSLGGAGNVARNIVALGGEAVLIGLRGRDAASVELVSLLAADANVSDRMVESAGRPTTCKTRVVAGSQQIVRLDDELAYPADEVETAALIAAVEAAIPSCAAVVLSDYAKGVLSGHIVAAAIAAAKMAGLPVLADPKRDDFSFYRGVDVLTPNAHELARAARLPTETEAEVCAAADAVMATSGVPMVLCTRADKGMTLLVAGDKAQSVAAEAREVCDVSGAGDTAIAALALAHAAGLPLYEAMRIANVAAGIVVGKLGTATVSREELEHALHVQGNFDLVGGAVWTGMPQRGSFGAGRRTACASVSPTGVSTFYMQATWRCLPAPGAVAIG